MPDINTNSDAYNTGFEAAKQGEPLTACPYPTESWEADNWFAGWEAQGKGEKAKEGCRKWVRDMVKAIGIGYHPDTRGADYSPPLTTVQVKLLDSNHDRAFELLGDEVYEVALEAQRALIHGAEGEPEYDGVKPHNFAGLANVGK